MEEGLMIRNKTRFCKEAFQRCLEIQDLAVGDWLEQKSAEFNWWISGLNADKIGPGSLDSRLMLRPDVRDVVADLLEGLITTLSKCEDIAKEEMAEDESLEESFSYNQHSTTNELHRTPSPWSDMSDGTGTETNSSTKDENEEAVGDLYREQKFYIETNIEILIRIHAAIKKSGLKFRNQRADDDLKRAEERYQHEKSRLGEHEALYGSDPLIGEHERFRRFLTRLVLQNGYKEELLRSMESNIQRFITEHGPEIDDDPYLNCQRKLLVVFRACLYDPSRLTPIQRRLINANIVRRNRLIHAGNARKAQSRADQHEPQFTHILPIVKEVTQQSQVEERKLDHPGQIPAAKPSYTPPIPKPTSRKSFVSQTATGLASNFSITTALVPTRKTKSAATKMSARVATIDYPKCPASKGPFPCPYCPSILSHAYTERNKWRHGPSSVEDASIHSFDASLDLEAHILSLHPEIHESEVDLMVDAGKRPVGIQRVACPLCRPGLVSNTSGEEDGALVHPQNYVEEIGLVHLEEDEHIATHIHEFSLQAFPWPMETKVQDKPGMSISHSTASTREEITFQGSGDTDPTFEIKNYLHNQAEILDSLQDAEKELLPLFHVPEDTQRSTGVGQEYMLKGLKEDRGDPFPKRLIIAVDFGTTYSAVSYVDVPQGCPSDSVDSRSIRSIGNYPWNYNYHSNDPMGMEVPTEVIYPLDRHFRDHFNLDNSEEHWKTGDSVKMPVTDEDGDISMLSDVSEKFRWGYQVHEVWNRPYTHSNTTCQPLSRFKLLLDNSQMTESVRRDVRQTINTLKRKNVIQGPLHVIADFLTYLLEHTRSELRRQGFDDSYEREMILCVPAIWTQKACRDMQACLAVAMKRANFTRADLQNKSIDNLFIVSEPEAAAAHLLSTSAEIKTGDCFILLDAGGGIVDANTYRVSREMPLRLETEIVAPGGGLHGSSYLNEDFRYYLEGLLAEETYLNDGIETIHGIVERITFEEFEMRIKRGFDYKISTSRKEIYIRGLRDNPAKGFRNECIYISRTSIINAVASGAVLRALDKANGPERIARSSYGILRTEPFGQYSEHVGLRPSYDRHDGKPYIKDTIDWVLKLGDRVPSVWQCEPFTCSHTFDVLPVRPFICKEILYVSDRATRSHYRKTHPNNQGAEYVGEIEVDFSSLRERLVPIEPIVNGNQQKVGKRHYRIDFTMAIKVVDRDLECFAIHDQKVVKKCRINIASGFRPGVK
ncbi:hypothetical protein BFJ68_g9394 [Fusarium oxysporum]|uniref:Uncharacterized protein n=1 Tax=Fusarium oxysporum TaxID=5507 RepID=A0A420QV12_FUSOX|nr:hypothetical protein BFJ68_g9394 [Fusarium oxysporum]